MSLMIITKLLIITMMMMMTMMSRLLLLLLGAGWVSGQKRVQGDISEQKISQVGLHDDDTRPHHTYIIIIIRIMLNNITIGHYYQVALLS